MPALLDLNWKPSKDKPDLPTDVYPYQGPAIYRGDGYSIAFSLLDGVDPYEPEGTLFAQVRKERLKANQTVVAPLAEFNVTVVDNLVTIALTGEQTITLPDQAFWDLQETFDDAPPRTWFTGRANAWGDITREDDSS